VTHIEQDGEPTPVFIPSERITLEQTIAAYTIDAAYANFLEQDTGAIEVGNFADLVVLSVNLFDLAPADISQVTVVANLLEGEVIYGDL
jgi:predicted amidohydrolase YtcJ